MRLGSEEMGRLEVAIQSIFERMNLVVPIEEEDTDLTIGSS